MPMRLTIEKIVYGGAGLARTEAGVVFVPGTAPGDVVEAEIVETKKDYATARLTAILDPSPDRQEPSCAAGCCHWQHIRYDRQVDYKEAIIRESLRRLGRLAWDGEIKRITGPGKNYRLRATFHVIGSRLGFMEEKTNRIVPITKCASLVPELNQFIATADPKGAREVHAISAPEVAAAFVAHDGTIRRTGRATIHVDGIRYRVNPETFFQANRFLLAPFINEVLEQTGPTPTHVLELYAGVGFFSIPLARVAQEIIAVESSHAAARQARENARLNGSLQLRVVEGQVDAALHVDSLKPSVVVLDPPRAGCGVKNAGRIAGLGPARIVYVSCNPATFAREAAVLVSKNYGLRRLTLVDQFPNTYHIEIVAQFEFGKFSAAD
ncbi:MAG: class I SAM-dependent RNA methyltransferase [Acidobacteria bacterium]|nr:class I SAM-dependent RNA methyltransferase [Acidobacteriota bacterium]